MLNRSDIENLVNLALSQEDAKAMLTSLAAERLDVRTLRLFVEVMQNTLGPDAALLKPCGLEALDCCGTGGSGISNYNTSTTVAFVLAAGGIPVTKFGNRAATSRCGSFDLLEELGFPIQLPGERVVTAFEETGLALLYAPQYYPALSQLAPIRRQLGIKTILNYIGPLLNPSRPAYRVLGVSNAAVQVLLASLLSTDVSVKRALLVRGTGNLDEITAQGTSQLYDIDQGQTRSIRYTPPSYFDALPDLPQPEADARASADLFMRFLSGEDLWHYRRLVCLNSGAGFYVTGKAASIDEGAALSEELLKSGEVQRKFEQCRRVYARVLA